MIFQIVVLMTIGARSITVAAAVAQDLTESLAGRALGHVHASISRADFTNTKWNSLAMRAADLSSS